MYSREGTVPSDKTFIEPLRIRTGEDSLQLLNKTRSGVPGVIKAREDHGDIDCVWPWKVPF